MRTISCTLRRTLAAAGIALLPLAAAAQTADQRAVAALDTRYQAVLVAGAPRAPRATGRSRQAAAVRRASSPPCSSAEYHQFDFFLGNWDTYDVADPDTVVARNHVTRMVDGCAVREVYTQHDGLRGESISVYDASRRVWHQTWVTSRGTVLLLNGGLEHGRMVLTATERTPGGATSLLRGVWSGGRDSVRETATRSTDGGKTWMPVFDIIFRPHRERAAR